ncbi:hypothetical protein OSTOST_04717, partial [Ostertagia ostertagi]
LVKKAGKWQNLVWISAERSLLEVVRLLSAHRVHRIPVLDPDTFDPVYILTHKRILKFIWCFVSNLTILVLDVYSRFDAIGIALQSEGFNLEVSVKEALQFKHIC